MQRTLAWLSFALAGLFPGSGPAYPALPDAVRTQPVDIVSRDGTVLAGTVISPAAPLAGVVLLPGSGPAERADLEPLARELAARGVAALTFDKRGCGESEGSWMEASLEDLADDALAAARTFPGVANLEGRRIGLWGHSQGVWVASLAAARSDLVGFLVGVSGGGLSPREVETFQYAARLDHAGVAPTDKARAMALVERYFHYLASGEGREAIARELEAGGSWAAALGLDRVLVSERYRRHWSWVATFDPRGLTTGLRVPVLLVFGEEDHLLPLRQTVAAWTASLAEAENPDFSVRVFPAAGHGLRVGGGPHGHGGTWAPGYLDLLAEWLAARGGTGS